MGIGLEALLKLRIHKARALAEITEIRDPRRRAFIVERSKRN